MLKKIRITLAIVFFLLTTLLFLDFTGTIHTWFGWMAKIQFLPALLAVNVGVVLGLIAITLLFGRIYCSVICPLGVMQDVFSKIAGKFKKNRFKYSPAKSWLRYAVLAIFLITLIAGIGFVPALLAPYSSYGRIASNLFSPIYQWINNILAGFAERSNSYAFYSVEIWIKGLSTFVVSAITFVTIGILAVRNGRTYCNTICPVGTILGFLAKFSLYKPTINTTKCNGCGLCARNCKASCIDQANHQIDYSRCVDCFDCIENCRQHAIEYKRRGAVQPETISTPNNSASRRNFVSTATIAALSVTALNAKNKKTDGGLAPIKEKVEPKRTTKLVPFGAGSINHFEQHCTGCQLCVSVCPNQVLRPGDNFGDMMQPYISYERGYCRPECTKCSEVCPTNAINEITKAEKSSIKIGTAIWKKDLCVVNRDNVSCGNCARHCPNGAIMMVPRDPNDPNSLKVPAIDAERCIGCGACENLCPSRPESAIYVEGIESHREI